ncbi:MAG: hypothetical protein DHS20C02_00060 [Micavibrio sp.]|nr:MAG: hypothetical protein DHS20C02_00060 [Micavibrio sp.]
MFTHTQIWLGIDRLASSNGYSPSGLAKKAGLDPTSFNKSKRINPDGKPRWPSTESLSKVLAITDSNMSDFFSLIDDGKMRVKKISKDDRKNIAHETAKILLDTKSVLFNASKPFTLKSGRNSPVYIDGRRLISFPEERSRLMDFSASVLAQEVGMSKFDLIAGGETAGIPYAAMIADRLQKPMLYVRKEPKGHGRMAQIEGHLPDKGKKRVVLVEDLQTDGGSKKTFVSALKKAGAKVEHGFVIFHYGIFKESEKNMKKLGIKLHALATWHDVLEVAKQEKYFDKTTLKSVESFLDDPERWKP